ncbi:GFA family protein [Erythrobacter litoralis]|nr:GFA family protein [Erythrobacter litoralis]
MCRRWGGAFFAGQDGGEVEIAGEAHVRTFQSSAWAERAFCDRCGSHLWFRFLPTGYCSFCAGLFDASIDKPIEKEIFCDEAAAWTHLTGDHDRKTGAEIIAEAEAAGFTFE